MNKPFFLTLILSAASIAVNAQAASPIKVSGAANNSDYYWVLSGVNSEDAYCKEACYGVLGPKKSDAIDDLSQQWLEIFDKNGWIYVGYNICENVSYSDTGVAQCDNYLGHLGMTFNNSNVVEYDATDGAIKVSDAQAGSLKVVEFIPDTPPAPIEIPNPVTYDKVPFRGNNIAAAEFSSENVDWIIQDGFPNDEELAYFASFGMNTYRIPIRWSYTQPELFGDLHTAYVEQLLKSTELYLAHGFNVIIDLHSYMRFQPDSSIEPSKEGKVVTIQELTDFWNKLSDVLLPLAEKYPEQLMFDLMNEPMKDLSSQEVLDRYNAVIKMLRDKNINNLILLEGAHWSGMHSWLSEKDQSGKTNGDIFVAKNIEDKANNYAINVHQYFDNDHSGTQVPCTNLPVDKIKAFINWANDNQVRFMVTEFGGADAGNCHAMIDEFLTIIHDSKQLLGWTLWAGGRHWGDYMLSNYKNGGAVELPSVLVKEEFLQAPKS